jgi:hypothetical protein
MKEEFEIVNMMELSLDEIIFINGGGPGWRWLGEVLGVAATITDFVYNLPLYTAVAIAEVETEVEQRIDTFNHR